MAFNIDVYWKTNAASHIFQAHLFVCCGAMTSPLVHSCRLNATFTAAASNSRYWAKLTSDFDMKNSIVPAVTSLGVMHACPLPPLNRILWCALLWCQPFQQPSARWAGWSGKRTCSMSTFQLTRFMLHADLSRSNTVLFSFLNFLDHVFIPGWPWTKTSHFKHHKQSQRMPRL